MSHPKTENFTRLKTLYATLDKAGQSLVHDAPPAAISAAATTFAASIAKLDVIVQTSSSAAEVQQRATASPSLTAAANQLSASLSKLAVYAAKNC